MARELQGQAGLLLCVPVPERLVWGPVGAEPRLRSLTRWVPRLGEGRGGAFYNMHTDGSCAQGMYARGVCAPTRHHFVIYK